MHPDRSSPTRRRPWSPHHSVRARFALTIGLTGLLFALATTLLVEWDQRQQLTAALGDASRREAQFLSQTLSLSLKERLAQIRQMADQPEVASGLADAGKLRLALEQVRVQHPELVWMAMVDVQGVVQVATGTFLEGHTLTSQPWHVEGLKGPWVGIPHPAGILTQHLPMDADGKPRMLLDLAVPVIDYEGVTVGVVVAMLDWQSIRDLHAALTSSLQASSGLESLLLSPSGEVTIGPDAYLGNSLQVAALPAILSQGQPDVIRWHEPEPYLTAAAPVKLIDSPEAPRWTLILRQGTDKAFEGLAQARRRMLLGGWWPRSPLWPSVGWWRGTSRGPCGAWPTWRCDCARARPSSSRRPTARRPTNWLNWAWPCARWMPACVSRSRTSRTALRAFGP